MSNHRLIPIRQIPFTKNNPEDSAENKEKTLQTIQEKIEKAENQLKEIEQKTVQKRKTADEEIKNKRKQWEKERENYLEEAQQLGYQQGFEQGKRDSVRHYEKMTEEAIQVLDKSNEEYKKIITESDETILQIALAVSEKIIKLSLEEDQTRFIPLTKALIDQVKDHPQITLYVSNTYYPLLVDNKEELSSILSEQVEFRIYPSLEFDHEQVMVETPFGKIDASIDSQLDEIKNKLFHVMEEILREHSNHSS